MKERTVHGLESLAMIRDGAWVPAYVTRPQLAGSLKELLELVFSQCHWLRKNGKPMSEKSRTDYFNHVMRSFSDLRELGFNLQKPWNLEQKHIGSLCEYWAEKGLTASTVQNRLMALSWFGAVVGRPGLVRGTHDYGDRYGGKSMKRHQSTDRDRSPLGCGVVEDEVIRRAMAVDETFGHMVKLQLTLGLRDKEVLRARPLRDMFWAVSESEGHEPNPARQRRKTQTTDSVRAYWRLPAGQGSKGGRPRTIELWQGDRQAAMVKEVCEFLVRRGKRYGLTLAQARDQSLGWSSLKSTVHAMLHQRDPKLARRIAKCNVASRGNDERCNIASLAEALGLDGSSWAEIDALPDGLRSDMNRYHELAKRAGFTKDQLGFTPHGLRHYFALRELEARGYRAQISEGSVVVPRNEGFGDASVLGLSELEYQQVVRYAVSRQMGHSRASVTASYYGKKIAPLEDRPSVTAL